MIYNGLGFDFSNLRSCTLYKKNRMVSMVFVIMFFTFLIISLVFLLIYLNAGTITVNGTPVDSDDPSYQSFFITFLVIMFSVSLFFLIFTVLSIVIKEKPYLYMDSDDFYSEVFYYIPKSNVYLTEKYVIKYNAFNRSSKVMTDTETIEKLFNKYIPWYGIMKYKLKDIRFKEKYTTVKVKYPRSYLTKLFKFSNDINVVPVSFTVSDTYTTAVSRRNTGLAKYNFDLVNRAQHFEIHPDIKKELHSLRETM